MAAELQDFSDFLALETDAARYAAFAQLLIRNQNNIPIHDAQWQKKWSAGDAHVVVGLANQPSIRYAGITGYTLLDDYLQSDDVARGLIGNANAHKLRYSLTVESVSSADMIILLSAEYGEPSNIPYRLRTTVSSATSSASSGNYSINFSPTLWKNRNYGQRAAMFGLIPSAITSAVLGAITSESATLTTAGTAIAKFLPGFVTAFGASHAIPPAALAFYALAATFTAAALVLLLASTLYRCAPSKNKNYAHLDVNRYFTTAR